MGDKLVRKSFVLGIIVLFIGASVYPVIAIKLNKSTNTIDKVSSQNFTSIVSSTDITVVEKLYFNRLYTIHDSIYIHGNDDFTGENGVTSGSGSFNDPYIIEGWEINASSKDGIIIKNTSVFFEIKGCYVHGGGTTYDGIVFYNVTNGVIKNNIITENKNGTVFRTQGYPLKENSCYNKIQKNIISYNKFDGIHFEHTTVGHHSYNQILLNNITGNTRGIFLIMSKENLIYCNNIISNSEFGVELFMCTGGGTDNKVYHNNFINNGGVNGQASCTCDCNDWDDGYPSGGNYWSDYEGEDNYKGPGQNIPGSDDIGDEPYMIFSDYYLNDYDWYPLMELFSNWTFSPFAEFTWTPARPEPNETIFFNASESFDYDGNIILYQWDWNNDGIFDENHTSPIATHIFEEAGYYPVTLRITDNDNLTDNNKKTVGVGNQPPRAPIIDGPTHGKVGVEYQYNFSLFDPDDDIMHLRVDWGDGTSVLWQGPYDSNTIIRLNHTWNKKGTYTIKAQVKEEDIDGKKSGWAALTVTMPKNKVVSINTLFLKLLEKYPLLESLLLLL